MSTHNFVFLLKCEFAFLAQLVAEFVEQIQTHILAKIQRDVVTNPVLSYQTWQKLHKIFVSDSK